MKLTAGTHCDGRRLVLLAPSRQTMPSNSTAIAHQLRYDTLLAAMQRLRGRVYLADGAIQASQLTSDHRHVSEADWRGWHVLLVEGEDKVTGCARYVSHSAPVPFRSLGVSRCPLTQSDRWSFLFRYAVEQEISTARQQHLSYVEVGGWALDEKLRATTEALRIALASYALAHILGECLGISTVTWRHSSSCILRRIGGRSLEVDGTELPPYFDPGYDCQMEVLRFDSRSLNERYRHVADEMASELQTSIVYRQPSKAFEREAVSISEHAIALAI